MNCNALKFKVRYSTSLHVRYHSKFHARGTATAIFEETARTLQEPIIATWDFYVGIYGLRD